MKPENIHIGLCSFSNISWIEIFYPPDIPRSKWFQFYAENFSTYEINSTFYKNPTVKTLQNWFNKVPDNFQFSVKAPKAITHLKRFIDAQNEIDEFYKICREGLEEKLSYILFQLPPSFDFSTEKLEIIVNALDRNFKNVVEFRNITWWNQEVFDMFAYHNIVFCSVSYPNLREDILSESGNVYVRLHGRPRLFYSGYSSEELEALKNVLIKNEDCEDVYIYFNNTAGVEGIQNALALKKLLIS